MRKIKHHIAIHFQKRQQNVKILEDFRTCISESAENRSKKKKFREISEIQRVVVHFLEYTQRHAEKFLFNFRIFEIAVLQKVRTSFFCERKSKIR